MQRAMSYNILNAIKEIVAAITKEEKPILPLHEKTNPVFEVPLEEIIVTPEPSPKAYDKWYSK